MNQNLEIIALQLIIILKMIYIDLMFYEQNHQIIIT